jgi:hypothetical protein
VKKRILRDLFNQCFYGGDYPGAMMVRVFRGRIRGRGRVRGRVALDFSR